MSSQKPQNQHKLDGGIVVQRQGKCQSLFSSAFFGFSGAHSDEPATARTSFARQPSFPASWRSCHLLSLSRHSYGVMVNITTMAVASGHDAELVAASLAGNREAFARIVEQYQSLICSIAYSATGSLTLSEDLAQETFLTAWKRLRDLREPAQLRPWLCGIVRRLAANTRRRQFREPIHAAEPLDASHDAPASDEPLPEQVMSQEEEKLLWRSLERLPETYREPLILFYREHRSIPSVAAALDLSEDAVKQRLTRGRRLLHEQVMAFVEGALARTSPGKAFTLGVLAALPMITTSAGAATVAATAAKGSATAIGATLVSVWHALLGPVVGLAGAWLGVRASLQATRTPRERRFAIRQVKLMVVGVVLFSGGFVAYLLTAVKAWHVHPTVFTLLGIMIPLLYTLWIIWMAGRYNREMRRIRDEERQRYPGLFSETDSATGTSFREYRSRWQFLGVPLVHVCTGTSPGEKPVSAKGWIAIGDRAFGILFAAGGVAVGGISAGGVAVGVLAVGGVSLGLLALGGFALGGLAIGGAAVGLLAVGGMATGWIGAQGAVAVAQEFALGGQALAQHANDALAREYFAQYPWLDLRQAARRNSLILLCWLPLLVFGVAWSLRKKQGRSAGWRNRGARHGFLGLALLALVLVGSDCRRPSPVHTASTFHTLTNGIRIVSLHFPHSTNMAIFTYLPLGLAGDEPHRAQWSHLIEHLVIRSTVSSGLGMANAETLPDHLRLDFYGHTANWEDGLSHHRRWLEGVPFTAASLAAEKSKVKSEGDFTARQLATHKFALAAWAQGLRHGLTNVALKGDVDRAELEEIQGYRDQRMVVLTNVVVCIAGGVDPQQVLAACAKKLSNVSSTAQPAQAVQLHHGTRAMTWDLDARHIVITWPIPSAAQDDFAALLVAAQWLNLQLFSDAEIKQRTGMALAGADLVTPEGSFLFLSASLRPGHSFEEVEAALARPLQRLRAGNAEVPLLANLGRRWADSLAVLPNPDSMKGQLPPNVTPAMVEMNLALQWGMQEYRYGPHKSALADRLKRVTAEAVQGAVRDHLNENRRSVITLQPSP